MAKRAGKGQSGYIRYEKKKRFLIMLLMFAIPVGIYVTGLIRYGNNKSVLTILAVVGMVPAAKFMVSWIMIMLVREPDGEAAAAAARSAKGLTQGFELIVTAYEGRMPLDAVVICGTEVVCASARGDQSRFAFMQEHMTKILNANGYFGANVRIFSDVKQFEGRIRQIAASPEKYREGIRFSPDERYPSLSREELILHTLMAISL